MSTLLNIRFFVCLNIHVSTNNHVVLFYYEFTKMFFFIISSAYCAATVIFLHSRSWWVSCSLLYRQYLTRVCSYSCSSDKQEVDLWIIMNVWLCLQWFLVSKTNSIDSSKYKLQKCIIIPLSVRLCDSHSNIKPCVI